MKNLFTKQETVRVGQEYVGLDPFTYAPQYMGVYKSVTRIHWRNIMIAIAAVMVVLGSVFAAFTVTSNNGDIDMPAPTTMVEVDEPSTHVVTAVIGDVVYGPEYVKKDLYVCNTESSSDEYAWLDDEYAWSDGIHRDVVWQQLLSFDIVMVWSIDDEAKYADFVADINLFNEYTHAGVRVEREGYVAQANDFIVPVVHEDIEGDKAWADMGVELQASSLFGAIDTVNITGAKLRFDDLGFKWWEYHTKTVLHEMGHLFGLAHTHYADGDQVDSIMSYESGYDYMGYLPGDIAGLKEVFC